MPTGISSNSITLQQYALQSNDPLIQKIVFSLLEVGSPLEDIPFVTRPTMKVNGSRVVNQLPTANWRKLNGSSVVASGTASPFQEQAYVLSNLIDIDRLLLMDENSVGNPASVQADMMIKSWTYDFSDKFFNNNHLSGNADAFVGLRQRLDDPTSWGTATTCKIDAGGVDVSDSGRTAATSNSFIQYLDQMLDSMGQPDGNGVVVYMNRNLRRRVAASVRLLGAGGGFDMTTDAFDRRVMTYRNAIIRSVGVKSDQSTEIITSTETSAGANGSSTFTSMYGVCYGEDQFSGWQMTPLMVQNIGLRPDEPTMFRFFLEWPVGLYQQNIRSVARVYDIKVA
jgi:hypothetical protein